LLRGAFPQHRLLMNGRVVHKLSYNFDGQIGAAVDARDCT
jgi:hypothetical protein